MTPETQVRRKALVPEKAPEPVPVTDLASGLRAIVNKPFLLRPKWADQQQRAVRDGAHPDILEFERRFIKRMARKYGVPLFADNMVRTALDQDALYVQGVTKARGGESPHNFGCAVDIVHSVFAWQMERQSWTMLGHIGKELAQQMGVKLVWGGDWSFYDPAHWELADWRKVMGEFPW